MRHIRAVGLYQIGLLLALTLHTCEGFTAPPSLSLSTRRHEFSGGSVHGYGFQKCTVVAPTRRVRSYHLHMGLFDDIASKVKDALQEVTVQHILVDTESQAVSIRKVGIPPTAGYSGQALGKCAHCCEIAHPISGTGDGKGCWKGTGITSAVWGVRCSVQVGPGHPPNRRYTQPAPEAYPSQHVRFCQ